MKARTRELLDTRLHGWALERAMKDAALSSAAKRVGRSAGFGTAVQWARDEKAAARARGRAARASRRRNRSRA